MLSVAPGEATDPAIEVPRELGCDFMRGADLRCDITCGFADILMPVAGHDFDR